MASPLESMMGQQGTKERPPPRTVLGVKGVDLILVRYTDDRGTENVQLAVVGDNNVHMINGRLFGLSSSDTPQGNANPWLRDAIFEKLGRKKS
jgi:hypothetical protein